METEKIQAIINAFEPQRLAARKSSRAAQIVGWVFVAPGFLSFVGAFFAGDGAPFFVFLGFWIMFFGGIIFLFSRRSRREFQKKLSAEVEDEVNKAIFPDAVINPKIGVSYETIMGPGFFSPPDRYIGTNLRTSNYHGISFEQSDFCLEQRAASTSGGYRGGGTTTMTYAAYAIGTIYHFAFERDFGQVVKVLEKQGTFSYNTNQLKKVETEYIDFNRKFTILASDETTCFFLLTPQIQEKIMAFEKMFKGQFYLAFIGRDLYICANNSEGSVPVPWKKPLTLENLQPVIESMALPAVFIDLLGLSLPKFEKNGGTDVK
jgi:hypothetical protein